MTWLDAEEYERRYAEYEERAFMRRPRQGDLYTPQIIQDGMRAVQSQTNGRMYDSKSELRKEYRRSGVEEVGNEKLERKKTTKAELEARKKERRASIGKALSYTGFGAP